VLSGAAVDKINDSAIKELVLIDTIPYPRNAGLCNKIKYISSAQYFGEAIRRTYEEVSISSLFR
jgi:ribose-phosphate pyrophosphokinase